MPPIPTTAELDREIAALETIEDRDLQWSVGAISRIGDLRSYPLLLDANAAARLMRLGITARLAQLEQQRADLGLRRSEGPTGNKTIENAAKARECYREALRQVAKRESLTPAELAPVVSNVSGANDCTDGIADPGETLREYAIPARLDHNQP